MTWATWITKVLTYLDVDATRRGITDLRTSYIKAGVIDLKHFVDVFKDDVAGADYANGDTVPFEPHEEKAAEATAMYIKSRFARVLDKDLALSESYWKDYLRLRRELIRESQEVTLKPKAKRATLEVKIGDSLILDVQIRVRGVAYDLTGLENAWFSAKELCCEDDTKLVIDKSLGTGIQVTDAATGMIRISCSPADTNGFEIDSEYEFQIRIKAAGGDVFTPDDGEGDIVFECAIKRDTA